MASAAVTTRRDKSRTNTSMLLLLQKKRESGAEKHLVPFSKGFPPSRQMSSELMGWFCPTGNGGKCRCR